MRLGQSNPEDISSGSPVCAREIPDTMLQVNALVGRVCHVALMRV